MLQIVLEKPGHFTTRQTEIPAIGTGQALVRIERIGVCGTDMHAFTGHHPFIKYPVVLGHELAATVVDVAINDRGIQNGDSVSIEPFRSCTKCHACQTGKPNCCENLHIIGIHVDGGMCPYLAVPIEYLHRSETLTLDQLALIEPLSIGAHAVRRSRLKPGEQVLVVGAGPIGIATTQFALLAGGQVTVAEINKTRLERVVQMLGVTPLVEKSDKRFDLVLDATGNAKVMEQSFLHVHHGGRLVFVGVIKAPITFDDALLHAREITLFASRNSHNQFSRIIELIEKKQFDPSLWITHRLALDHVPEQFEATTHNADLIKLVIQVPDELARR